MLDIFGNVFGRSKKTQSSQSLSATAVAGGDNENADGYIVVQQTSYEQSSTVLHDDPPLYPTTILTDEMIRLGANGAQQIPSASSMANTSSDRSHAYSHQRSYSSPIDCVPFATVSSGAVESANGSTQEAKCFETIDRIRLYLSTPSQSEYTFNLENSILSESLLS